MTRSTLKWGHITTTEVILSEARAGEAPRVERWFPFPQTSYGTLHRTLGYEFLY